MRQLFMVSTLWLIGAERSSHRFPLDRRVWKGSGAGGINWKQGEAPSPPGGGLQGLIPAGQRQAFQDPDESSDGGGCDASALLDLYQYGARSPEPDSWPHRRSTSSG